MSCILSRGRWPTPNTKSMSNEVQPLIHSLSYLENKYQAQYFSPTLSKELHYLRRRALPKWGFHTRTIACYLSAANSNPLLRSITYLPIWTKVSIAIEQNKMSVMSQVNTSNLGQYRATHAYHQLAVFKAAWVVIRSEWHIKTMLPFVTKYWHKCSPAFLFHHEICFFTWA